MDGWWTPCFSVSDLEAGCRLSLGGVAFGEGETLQEAADDLIVRLLGISARLREHGWCSGFGPPDPKQVSFLWELGAVAARGDDVRDWLFGRASDRV